MRQLENIFGFLLLLFFVLAVNFPIISFDFMYPEQSLMYLANQQIHSLRDLLAVYAHPKMFHIAILFFRPSGHFLMYQMLGPLLGWHNTQAFIIVNLTFLALTGFFIIKVYELLFPGLKGGGYLAFAVYLMHPALMLSRLIVLHFEFAYVFFGVLSLYYFLRFCNAINRKGIYLAVSMCLYILAVSFKEPALMLGPTLIAYWALFHLGRGDLRSPFNAAQTRQVLLLLLCVTFAMILYLSLQWPSLHHPLRNNLNASAMVAASYKYLLLLFGMRGEFFPLPAWRNVFFPFSAQLIIWTLLAFTFLNSLLVFAGKNNSNKRTLVFLSIACLLFLLFPIVWAWGLPWHLSLTLLFLSLLMGFSVENLASKWFRNKKTIFAGLIILSLLIGLDALPVNQMNIDYYVHEQGLALSVGRNAILHPPAIQDKLKNDSIIVVEDSKLHDAYLLGASIYPYFSIVLNNPNLAATPEQFQKIEQALFIPQQPIYNGTLFRWAYLKPFLREEVYPFQVEHMQELPSAILYNWLQHESNIFCLGYDEQGAWQDRTTLFKKNLLIEKAKRHLVAHAYTSLPLTALGGTVLTTVRLPFPEPQLCQFDCDQTQHCRGFTYIKAEYKKQPIVQCQLYKVISEAKKQPCAFCIGFIKDEAGNR